MKTFSVVLSYYKKPELLSRALYGLSQQTYPHFEVIPAFDGEDSEALFVYERFRSVRPDVRFRDVFICKDGSPEEHGNRVRKLALAYCNNDYVVWYGHDCLIDKDYLETHSIQIGYDWCISIVSQAHYTQFDHQKGYTLYREILPRTLDPEDLRMMGVDLLNFAVPRHVAEEHAWSDQSLCRYEADWFTLQDIRNGTKLPVRISPKIVCAHF